MCAVVVVTVVHQMFVIANHFILVTIANMLLALEHMETHPMCAQEKEIAQTLTHVFAIVVILVINARFQLVMV